MSWLNKLINGFDYLTGLFLAKSELEKWRKALSGEVKRYDSPVTRLIYEAFDAIDSKTTAVLQHVSIMIAVSGVLFWQAKGVLQFIFGIEMVGYVILTLFCLRFLMQQEGATDEMNEIARREMLFEMTAKLAFAISICLIVTVIFELGALR